MSLKSLAGILSGTGGDGEGPGIAFDFIDCANPRLTLTSKTIGH
jgi:hypothetical protein